jgi:hypothetical protein
MFKRVFASAVLALAVTPLLGQNVCPCIPISHQWIVTACETWNCAMSAMVLANGDPYVVSAPTGGSQFKWIVARRVVAGTATVSPDDPFVVDSIPNASDAATRFSTIPPENLPIIITTVDGDSLLIRLKEPDQQSRRRAAGH